MGPVKNVERHRRLSPVIEDRSQPTLSHILMDEECRQDGDAAAGDGGDPDRFGIIDVKRRSKRDGRGSLLAVQEQPIVLSSGAKLDDRVGGEILRNQRKAFVLEIAGGSDNTKVDISQLLIADFG